MKPNTNTNTELPVIGKVYEEWEKPKPSKKTTDARVPHRKQLLGGDFPSMVDYLNDKDYEFEAKKAQMAKVTEVTKKVRLSNKAKSLIRKDTKIERLYNTQAMKTDISPAKVKERDLKKSNNKFAKLRKNGKAKY